ncbi:PREDICTED: nucleolar protein 7 [Ceratotherium simum simum]|uniref:Nucleolar protein 7 n=1 Tax=Ceratotherium simum simum TaxID=73337 RepID=A0ABM0HR58_CERSS|nr:PREDICTED: nucleolar protein 7 [Ceratotherium simum simum]
MKPASLALHVTLRLRAASGSEVRRSGVAWVMVQLRQRVSRAPASASAMVDEGQPASEEEAEHGLLLGQPSSGAAAEPLEDDEEGDDEFEDDEAPEELTFASARAEAREEERRVRETVRRDKTLLKEKRKRREELFIEQKKRKLLPDAILDKLTTASQTNIKKSPEKLQEVNLQKKNEECEKGSNSKKTKEKVQKVQSVGQNRSYLAVRLKDQDLRDSRQEAAKAFIQNCLYGPGTNRTTVNKFLSLDNKRLPVKKAAAQFLNNAWGTQRKQNAKRFKRRWMIRKMKTSKK